MNGDDDDEPIAAHLQLDDELSADRTMMSNERTMLSYIRTSVALVVAGASAIKLFPESRSAITTGWAFVVAGAVMVLFGMWRFFVIRSHVRRRAQKAAETAKNLAGNP